MNLCVSNIGWKQKNNEAVYKLLNNLRIPGIDIAPTLFKDNIEEIDTDALLNKMTQFNLKIIGIQSLLYTCPQVSLFDGEEEKQIILKHLHKCFNFAKKIHVKKLIFGSPKNRFIKNTNTFNINSAVDVFKNISDIAAEYGCIICFEANPKEYGCNFITNNMDALVFIKNVNHSNFKLNLDLSTLILNNECLNSILQENLNLIEHIHISSPFLKSILQLNNNEVAATLKKFNYNKWVALECNFQNEDAIKNINAEIAAFHKEYNI